MGGWDGGELEKQRREQLYFALLKVSFHILEIKRAAAHAPQQHFKKVCQKHMALQY